ncbi:MAG: DUF3793 family protein [Spirochaetales bacterium]
MTDHTVTNLESYVIAFCAPVFVGIKPACLFSLNINKCLNLDEEIATLNNVLSEKGVCIRRACDHDNHVLIFVYRPLMLKKRLFRDDIKNYLIQEGYSIDKGFDAILLQLFDRLKKQPSFPHEIGVFLGYPLEDVLGFVKYRGRNCKMFGYWKVYGNKQKAQKLFAQYDRCKRELIDLYKQGVSFLQLCNAS